MGLAVLPGQREFQGHVLGVATCGLFGPVHGVWSQSGPKLGGHDRRDGPLLIGGLLLIGGPLSDRDAHRGCGSLQASRLAGPCQVGIDSPGERRYRRCQREHRNH